MGRSRTTCLVACLLLLSSTFLYAQKDVFARKVVIPLPAIENGAFGNVVAGVDLDGDGKPEIYAVNNDVNDTGNELIPRIYKWVFNGTTWDSVWSATLPVPLQNTWPTLTYGDLDGDGKMEIIWGPVNNTNPTTNPHPPRIVVFEAQGGGSTAMGVSDAGGYRPNAQWTIDTAANYNLRPFRWFVADLKGDGKKEVVFSDRASSTTGYRFGILSVDNIPDNGDGSETWKLEYSGKDSVLTSGQGYDLAIIDSTIFLIHSTGNVTPIRYRNGSYTIGKPQLGLVPGGSWKSSSVVDIDNDGTKEIVVASNGAGNNNIYLLQLQADTLVRSTIATVPLGATNQFYGGANGDFDNDGKLDFVFGSRNANPDAAIIRLKYLGGSITSPSSYQASIIDQEQLPTANRWDIFSVANLDADADQEIAYSAGYPGTKVPITILDRLSLNWIPISSAVADTNHDFVPDMNGDTVTVIGVVNSANFTASANRFSYSMQDTGAGINVTKAGVTGGGPVYNPGDKLAVKGVVGQFNGVTQLNITGTLDNDLVFLGSGYPVTPIEVTVDKFLANGETYENRLVLVKGVTKAQGSAAWPAPGSDANMTFWDGVTSFTLRIDHDSHVNDSAEVTYPVNVQGLGTQFKSSAPFNSGYQIQPSFYSDFTQHVNAPPNRHIHPLLPAPGSQVILNHATDTVKFVWNQAVDLNGDVLIYQWMPVGFSPVGTGNSAHDTLVVRTGAQMLTYLGTKDTVVLKWTVGAKDPTNPLVVGIDTASVTIIRGTLVGVPQVDGLPTEFALSQNFPNPFNPSTTIKYALPAQSEVTLKIYDVLGREVTTLFEGQVSAGYHDVVWNGRNRSGAQVSSGVYFFRINAHPANGGSDFSSLKKMMLLK